MVLTVSPWSGRLRSSPTSSGASTSVARKDKWKKKVSDCTDAVLDGDSSGSESLDEELGIPSVRTPDVQRTQSNAKKIGRAHV